MIQESFWDKIRKLVNKLSNPHLKKFVGSLTPTCLNFSENLQSPLKLGGGSHYGVLDSPAWKVVIFFDLKP